MTTSNLTKNHSLPFLEDNGMAEAGPSSLKSTSAVSSPSTASYQPRDRLKDSAISVGDLGGTPKHMLIDGDSEMHGVEEYAGDARDGLQNGEDEIDQLSQRQHGSDAQLPLRTADAPSSAQQELKAQQSLDDLRRNIPERSVSAPPGQLLEDAILRGSAEASMGAAAATYYSLWQPNFPQIFDVFDYGDGICYYLGGGGHAVSRHANRRHRRGETTATATSHWPFANPPLYACQLHQNATGAPSVVLFSGPDVGKDDAWADVQFGTFGTFGRGMTIGIPPLPHEMAWAPLPTFDGPGTPATPDDGRSDEKLSVHFGWHNRYRFEVEVGSPFDLVASGKPRTREVFEWRYCPSAELEALDEPQVTGRINENGEEDADVGSTLSSSIGPPRPHTSLGMVGDKAGQFLKRKLSQGFLRGDSESEAAGSVKSGKSGKSLRKRPSLSFLRSTPKKKASWRGGWQLVRLANATDPLARAFRAAATTRTAITTISEEDEEGMASMGVDTSSTTPRVSSPESTLHLDHLIGEEAGRAAERRRTPDGREIVATWANIEQPRKAKKNGRTGKNSAAAGEDVEDPPASTLVAARFKFLGSGKTGQLGERWALMAVVSGLAIWERERKAQRRRQNTVAQACGGLANIV